jgi:hypothetical protein
MMRFGSAAIALLALFGAGCQGARQVTASGGPPVGAMSYEGYDASGHLVVVGWIDLDIPTLDAGSPIPSDFSGSWGLSALTDPDQIGPQHGTGTLAGRFTDSGVVVELQPGQADNGVVLSGTLTAGGPVPMRFEGIWEWTTLSGVRATGTFHASQ